MAKLEKKPTTALYPLPAVLVTCVDEAGKPNIITIAWAGVVCSQPPMVSIAIRPHRYSHPLIAASGEFVVNIPGEELLRQTDGCGMVSGRDVDKFEKFGLTPEPGSKTKVPLIKECPVCLECKVTERLSLGTHDLFIGEVLAVHIEEGVLDEKGGIDFAKARPITFTGTGAQYWNLKEKIGHYGFTR
ncbi:MAG: flavin reductase [Planctomycetes bacterium DG_23]|nr:MAG: flavin reductase [Planctomycetes bacterium DG_23]